MNGRITVWILVTLVAAGCTRRKTAVVTGAREQILHIGNGAEPKDLDPATQESAIEYTICTALFEGLVDIANDGQTILPGVAERWDISADGRIYTFHLRPAALWSDGTPVTAGDFLYAFRRVFTPALASPGALYGFAITGAHDFATGKTPSSDGLGVRAIDPHTFEVRLDYRAPYLLYLLAGAPFVPVPRTVLEAHGGGNHIGSDWTRPGIMVSNGPFVLAAWHPNQDLVVTPNPHYWDRQRMRLRGIRFYPIDNAAAEERAYRAGELHVTYALPSEKIAVYRQPADGQLHVTPLLDTAYLFFNTTKPPFNDMRIRRAFALALDREQLIPRVLHEGGTAAHSLTRPGTDGYAPPPLADYDPARARQLLAAAGYPNGANFPVIEFSLSSNFSPELGEALQQAWWQQLGVRVLIARQEQKVFLGRLTAKNFQMGAMTYFYAVNAPEAMLMVPLSDSPWNYAGWKNRAYDRAYDQANHTATASGRFAAVDRMEALLNAEAPYAPLFFVNQAYLVNPMVRGWRDNALGQIDWRELWLQEPK